MGSGEMKLDALRTAVDAGTLATDKVMKALAKTTSWRNRAWHKARRQQRADCCDLCRSTSGLRVVDKWHPAPFAELCHQVAQEFRDQYAVTHPLVLPDLPPFDPATVPPPETETRECCPWCGSVDIVFKSSAGGWSCRGTRRGRQCGHIFSQPVRRPYQRWSHAELIAQARQARDDALRQPAEVWEAAFQAEFSAQIERQALLRAMAEWERYLAVEAADVQTLCKRCAAKSKAAAELAAVKLKKAKSASKSGDKAPGRGAAVMNRLRQLIKLLRPDKLNKSGLTGS